MRQDKDRSSKWLIAHHGDAILKLAGLTGFTEWRAIQPETIAPRRLPDGLLEVRFPGFDEPSLVLIEIESYADSDADRQVFDDVALVYLERKRVPEVVSPVLKSKGCTRVAGTIEHASPAGRTKIGGSWPVVRLWDLDAESLLADGDAGLIPWVPLAQSNRPPEELVSRCVDHIGRVPDATERQGLLAVTQIMAGLAFPDRRFPEFLRGSKVMIESPILDEVYEEGKSVGKYDGIRLSIQQILEDRFGPHSDQRLEKLSEIEDKKRLRELVSKAVKCPSLEAFVAEFDKKEVSGP